MKVNTSRRGFLENTARIVALMAIALTAWMCADADVIAAGHGARISFTNETDVVQSTPIYLSSGSLGPVKYGGGSWTIPAPLLLGGGEVPLTVAGGTLAIEDSGAAPSLAEPTDILAKAAFWVDASKAGTFVSSNKTETVEYKDEVTGETTNSVETTQEVCYWHDARETSPASPTRLYARKGNKSNHTPAFQPYDGTAAVYFHEYARDDTSGNSTKGSYMEWCTNGVQCEISGIRHAFAVHAVSNSYGMIFGSAVKPRFICPWSGTPVTGLPYWPSNSWRSAGINAAKTFLDGEWIDTYRQTVLPGLHLLEVQADNDTLQSCLQAGQFFCDRKFYGTARNRSGGDYLSEALVFTNALSEAERMQVQAYLMQKWGIAARNRTYKPTVYGDATAVIPATSFAGADGDGTVETTGAGMIGAYSENAGI